MTTHVARYREIADVLGRHGLDVLVQAVGLGGRRSPSSPSAPDERIALHLRLALQELGPTFVKLGQLLSTRPDLLPESFIAELSKLQDDAPPIPLDDVLVVIEDELGADPQDVFAMFDPEPLASASIGQVHAARRQDGTDVVVKVRRPDAVARVREDVAILRTLGARANRMMQAAQPYQVTALVDEFCQTLLAELDYFREGQNAERFSANFLGDRRVLLPQVFWDTTTTQVLTMQRMTGMKITDTEALDAAGVDRAKLARTGASIVLQMIFRDRFFHADPHPGNFFVAPDGRIALIDFGMVGEIPDELADALVAFLTAFTFRRADDLADALIDLSAMRAGVDRDELRAAMVAFISEYDRRPFREIGFTRLASRLLAVAREQHLQLPREVPLMLKVLVMMEGIGLQLDPEFDLFAVVTPFVHRLLRDRLSPSAIAQRVARASWDAGELLLELPSRLRRILEVMERSGLDLYLRAAELEPLVRRAERIGNRLTAGMIAAALISGIGGVVTSEARWRRSRGALVGTGLTAISALIGYLVVTARPGRR